MLQELKDIMSVNIYGMTAKEANSKKICISCKEEALPKCYSEAGKKEFFISGMCEECFDNLFKED